MPIMSKIGNLSRDVSNLVITRTSQILDCHLPKILVKTTADKIEP